MIIEKGQKSNGLLSLSDCRQINKYRALHGSPSALRTPPSRREALGLRLLSQKFQYFSNQAPLVEGGRGECPLKLKVTIISLHSERDKSLTDFCPFLLYEKVFMQEIFKFCRILH